jgi:alanine racemase
MRAQLTIDLGAIGRNVRRLRSLSAPARYAAVVKADAYGHGLVPVARALARTADAFCVYRADEAATLRDAGIAAPILILGPVEARELDLVVASRATIALWSEGAFRRDAARAARQRGARLRAHAKIDTGVARLGLAHERAAAAIAGYLGEPALDLRGVFTHLAAAEELESGFTLTQLERFERALAPLDAALAARNVMRHAAASAAAMLFPRLRLDAIRAGIATYGIWPSEETRAAVAQRLELEPALTWTTDLVVVRDVDAGETVGYGCSFRTVRPSRIGVLPIGYAEGLPRALSNNGVALAGGRRVPFVGRVCMNMAFVDVTGVPDAVPGSRVTLLGCDGAERIEAGELAGRAGTIGYELVARLPSEVPRRYAGAEEPDENVAIASAKSSVPS